ncbi:MAG: mandelate racemase/muconate lactonizing enzyme family protein, partial [Saprospiraceae bacterium]|nr:mandelate racemase/muconate lactonizing enzyme family protein [Saprospiraceae bacterium]
MTTPSEKFLKRFGLKDPAPVAVNAQPGDNTNGHNRRDFIRNVGFGGLALGAFINSPITETLEHSTSKVNRASAPSDLKITDMRYATVMNGGARCPVIRIDTNQGIYGLGEVRDGANWRYALFLKSRIMGMNPCNVEMIFKKIKQFGFHARQAGGVCAVEMALWDLAGKAYNVPAYQLLGGKYRDKIRLYADTPRANSPEAFAAKMKDRVENKGYTFLKMDFGVESLAKIPGTVANSNFWDIG